MGKIFGGICLSIGFLMLVSFGVFSYGKRLPEYHTEVATITLNASVDEVWQAISQFESIPEWWSEVIKVQKQVTPEGKTLWWSFDRNKKRIAYETIEEVKNQKLVRQIATTEVPFGGSWTFELTGQGPTTQLTLTEYGFIRPPFYRAMARFMGQRKNLDSFVSALKKHVES